MANVLILNKDIRGTKIHISIFYISVSQPVGRGPLVGREALSGGPRGWPKLKLQNNVVASPRHGSPFHKKIPRHGSIFWICRSEIANIFQLAPLATEKTQNVAGNTERNMQLGVAGRREACITRMRYKGFHIKHRQIFKHGSIFHKKNPKTCMGQFFTNIHKHGCLFTAK